MEHRHKHSMKQLHTGAHTGDRLPHDRNKCADYCSSPWALWWDPVWGLPKETQATQRVAWTVNITSENRTVRLTVIKAFPIPAWVSLQNKKEHFSKTYNGDFTCKDLKPRRLKDKTKTNNSHTSPKFSLLCHSLFSTNPTNANKNTDSQFTLQVVWW